MHGLLREDISVKIGRIKEYPPRSLNGGKIIQSRCCAGLLGFRKVVTMFGQDGRVGHETVEMGAWRWTQAAYQRTRGTYGPSRLQRDLTDYGIFVGIGRIKHIRRKLTLQCKQKRQFKATTHSKQSLPIEPNLLTRDITALAPNRAWAGGITYIPTVQGWLSLKGLPSGLT